MRILLPWRYLLLLLLVVVVVGIIVVVIEVVVVAVRDKTSGCGSSSKILTWTGKNKLGGP